jgi:hypothetical protein
MRGETRLSNPNHAPVRIFRGLAYWFPNKGRGEPMTTQIIQNKRYLNSQWSERMQDFLLVSSFGVWAAVLGLSPVLAFRLLMGS